MRCYISMQDEHAHITHFFTSHVLATKLQHFFLYLHTSS